VASEQEVAYHRSFLSPFYLDNFIPPTRPEMLKRRAAEIDAIRDMDLDAFEEHRRSLAFLLKVPYRPRYMVSYPGDQGGRDHWVDGNPTDAQVAECLAPLYPPQGAVKSPTTGLVAMPMIGFTHKAFVYGKNLQVNLFQKLDQEFEDYATPWELQWSNLIYPYNRGFTPLVDNSWTVIGHTVTQQGSFELTNLIIPIEFAGLFDIQTALVKGVPLFVHSAKDAPSGWVNVHFTTDDMVELTTGIDGEVLGVRLSATAGLGHPWYSPMDLISAGRVVVSLGKLGAKVATSLARKATAKLAARSVLKGATKDLAKDAVKDAAKLEAKDETKKTFNRALSESDLKPLVRNKSKPSRVLTPAQMETFLREIIRKRPYLIKLRSVTGNDALRDVIKEWETNTGKSFLKVTKGTPTRLGSEGVGGWALDSISGKEVMVIEGDVFRHESQAVIEVTHELAYEAVREGADRAMPFLNVNAPLCNAMQWLEGYIQHGEIVFESLRDMGEHTVP
jgi:hypothetical protein